MIDPRVHQAIEDMRAWGTSLLADRPDEYQLYLITLGSVDEYGQVDQAIAEEYRVRNDGDDLDTGVAMTYPYALRPCPERDTASVMVDVSGGTGGRA
ncbi:hypothetical protein ACTG9Q_21355 [Actinokineospora sp. 24-640]